MRDFKELREIDDMWAGGDEEKKKLVNKRWKDDGTPNLIMDNYPNNLVTYILMHDGDKN